MTYIHNRMASRLVLLTALLLFCILQVSSDAEIVKAGANRRLLSPFVDCDNLCLKRCELHSRPNVCTRACGTCCTRCKCVPPGTHGNRELCGKCYTDMTTHGNRTKCP